MFMQKASLFAEGRGNIDAGLAQATHRIHRALEHLLFVLVKVDLDDALNTASTDHGRNADIDVVEAILTRKVCRARQNALLVLQISFGHLDGRGCRCVVSRTGLEEANDLCAAVAGALDDLVELLLRGPAHLDQIRQRDAGNGRITGQRNHGVAVAAENEGSDVFHRNLELFCQEQAEARGVENTSHADNVALRQAGELLQRPDHSVERIGDADDEGVRRVLLDAGADLLHDLEVDAEKVVAAHARLAGHAGGDDANISAFNGRVVVGADEVCVKAINRGGLGDVEALALRGAFGNVEQNNVAEFLEADHMGEGAADHARADEGNFVASHVVVSPVWRRPRPAETVMPKLILGHGRPSKIRSSHSPISEKTQPVLTT